VTTVVGEVELAAPAKINLYLQVTGRRPDGYHYLATLMQKISLYDRVILRPVPSGIQLHCPDSGLPEDEGNLAYRAARLFFQATAARLDGSKGVEITLLKSIPVAAGLGGGSSDAAAVLRGMDRLYRTDCRAADLMELGVQLGADVPLFLVDWPAAWATGIGERLRPAAPLTGCLIVLVNPGFPVPTAWVYQNFALTAEGKNFNLSNLHTETADQSGAPAFTRRAIRPDEMRNDLEMVTISRYRELDGIKGKLLRGGAVAALMSGSGPSIFGLFPENEAEKAAACCRELQREYQSTFLVNPLAA